MGEGQGETGTARFSVLTFNGRRPPHGPVEVFSRRARELELGLDRRGGLVRVPDPAQRAANSVVVFVIVVNFVLICVVVVMVVVVMLAPGLLDVAQVRLLVLQPGRGIVESFGQVWGDRHSRRGIWRAPEPCFGRVREHERRRRVSGVTQAETLIWRILARIGRSARVVEAPLEGKVIACRMP